MTADAGDPGGLLDLTGDAAGADVLRRSLTAMAQQNAGTPLGDKVGAVLAGRITMRELAQDDEFLAHTQRGMQAHDDVWQAMTPDERHRVTVEGEAYLTELRGELDDQSSSGPSRRG